MLFTSFWLLDGLFLHQWPSFIIEMFRIMSAFNFNVDITAPECSLKNLSYETKWWIIMFLPVAAAGIFFLIFVGNAVVKYFFLGIRVRRRLFSHRHALIGMFFAIFYFLYLYLYVLAVISADLVTLAHPCRPLLLLL
jgi:hypothetical protein